MVGLLRRVLRRALGRGDADPGAAIRVAYAAAGGRPSPALVATYRDYRRAEEDRTAAAEARGVVATYLRRLEELDAVPERYVDVFVELGRSGAPLRAFTAPRRARLPDEPGVAAAGEAGLVLVGTLDIGAPGRLRFVGEADAGVSALPPPALPPEAAPPQ